MGADFLISGCRVPVDRFGRAITEWSDALEVALRKRIAEIEPDHLDVLVENVYPEPGEEITNVEQTLEAAREAVQAQSYRTATIGYFGDERGWIVTGGQSYGDVPTEEFDAVALVGSTLIFDEPFDLEA